jgi:hypothetical protein
MLEKPTKPRTFILESSFFKMWRSKNTNVATVTAAYGSRKCSYLGGGVVGRGSGGGDFRGRLD